MKHAKTSLFLMELIISILFFSITTVICVQIFVKSHRISAASVDLNRSVQWSENLAELYYGCDGDLPSIQEAIASGTSAMVDLREDSLSIFFDKDWKPITASSELPAAVFRLSITLHEADTTTDTEASGQVLYADVRAIKITDRSRCIYELKDLCLYVKESLSERRTSGL